MNLASLMDSDSANGSGKTRSSSRNFVEPKNVKTSVENTDIFYLPTPLTEFQRDTNELLVHLHQNHTLNNEKIRLEKGQGESTLSDLLYTNLNLTSNNPYLLVNHYIPRNMLLMNTKDTLNNMSGKFKGFDKIVSYYEALNDSTSEKYNILVLANSSKEFDFIESLLLGRLVNYKRYTGSKIYEPKNPETVTLFDDGAYNGSSGSNSAASSAAVSNKRSLNSKDDPYLIKRLKRKHRRLMKNIKHRKYCRDYCLTVHLVSVNQLKFQFFTAIDDTYHLLKLSNKINFNYIISFNSYLNLDHFYLNKLRHGYIAKDGNYIEYSEPKKILCFLSTGSIEHCTLVAQKWLTENSVVDENKDQQSDYIDERPTKIVHDEKSVMIILKLYLLNRFDNAGDPEYENIIKDWLFSGSDSIMKYSSLPVLREPTNPSFNEYMRVLTGPQEAADPLFDAIKKSAENFNLKYYDFKVPQSLKDISNSIERNKQIFNEFSYVLKEFELSSKPSLLAEREIGDSKQIIIENGEPKRLSHEKFQLTELLNLSTEVLQEVISDLTRLEKRFYDEKKESLNRSVSLTDLSFSNYKKFLTQILQQQSTRLEQLNRYFEQKSLKECTLGNYLQLRIEKNNFISKNLFEKQLELNKSILKEEKYVEKVSNDYGKRLMGMKMASVKIENFEKFLKAENVELKETFTDEEKIILKEIEDKISEDKIEDMKQSLEASENGQEEMIKQLESEIDDLDNKAQELSNSIEESRVSYQAKSAKISSQLESLGHLDSKIATINDILNKQVQLLDLKEKALSFDIASQKESSFVNASVFNSSKYDRLGSQKYFMENYMGILQHIKSGNKVVKVEKTINGKRRR